MTFTTKRYYTMGGITVAVRDSAGTGSLNYLLGDQLGSTTVSVNAAGGTPVVQRYLPYGAPRSTTGGSAVTDRGWIGQTKDNSTGLQYLNARYYDPTIGRFTAVDPLADLSRPGTLDAYGYALGNPLTLSDPNGLFTCPDAACVFGGGGFLAGTPSSSAPSLPRGGLPGPTDEPPDEGPATSHALGGAPAPTTTGTGSGWGALITVVVAAATSDICWFDCDLLENILHQVSAKLRFLAEHGFDDPQPGEIVYRVYGGDADEFGRSWTPVDPVVFEESMFPGAFRYSAGLPDGNYGTDIVLARIPSDFDVESINTLGGRPMPVVRNGESRSLPGGYPEYEIPGGCAVIQCFAFDQLDPAL